MVPGGRGELNRADGLRKPVNDVHTVDAGVTFDLVHRIFLVGAEPEPANRHGIARPDFELAAMAGAIDTRKRVGGNPMQLPQASVSPP